MAIDAETAAVAYLFGPGIPSTGLKLSETVAIAHKHNVPVIVDAAAMLPPRENLKRYIVEGADLVTFSGGKFIKGPQGTGLLFGRKDLIEAAMLNANPNHGVGRPHKVAKEDMVGLYVALRRYMQLDEPSEMKRLEALLAPIRDGLSGLSGVDVRIQKDEQFPVPVAIIRFNSSDAATASHIARRLMDGDPRIFVVAARGQPELTINPIGLADEHPAMVLRRLREEINVTQT
jgi:L-seryl-tRNA(Ser) seleniumtransferase